MHIVHVHIQVKPEHLDTFMAATIENARNSLQEEGVLRIDVIRQTDIPNHFVLVEVYRTPEDQLSHRETAHYLKWRDTVADMMAEPRVGINYQAIYPDGQAGWGG